MQEDDVLTNSKKSKIKEMVEELSEKQVSIIYQFALHFYIKGGYENERVTINSTNRDFQHPVCRG